MFSSFDQWLFLVPLWQIALLAFGGLFAASMAGGALRKHHDRAAARAGEGAVAQDGEPALLISAILGLLALLLGFTFSIAISRFDVRRVNVLSEANAIGTTYLRSQLLDEPHRARLSGLLNAYTDVRIAAATTPPGSERAALLKTSDRIIVDLWSATVAAKPSIRANDLSKSFLEAMNNLIDMDATRRAGRYARIPGMVFMTLLLYQFVTAGLISYTVSGRTGRRTALILFALLGVLVILIIDLERPTRGGITNSQEPMLQLRAFLRSQPPQSFDKFLASRPSVLR